MKPKQGSWEQPLLPPDWNTEHARINTSSKLDAICLISMHELDYGLIKNSEESEMIPFLTEI